MKLVKLPCGHYSSSFAPNMHLFTASFVTGLDDKVSEISFKKYFVCKLFTE